MRAPFQTGARPCRIPPPPPLLTPAASPRSPLLRPTEFVAQKTGDKVWVKAESGKKRKAKDSDDEDDDEEEEEEEEMKIHKKQAGHEGDALTVELLLKKQDSGLWRAEKLVVSTPEPVECLACAADCARCSCPTDHSCCEECVFGHSLLPAVCSSPDTCSDERTCQPHWWYTLYNFYLQNLLLLVILANLLGFLGDSYWISILAILVAAAHVSTGGRGSFSSLAIAGSSILAIAWILMNQRHAVALVAPADRERRHLQYVQDQPARIDAPDGAAGQVLTGHDGADAQALTDAAPYPSGLWRGYYNQGGRNFALCEFELEFGASGLVRGRGKDTVGDYTIAGRFAGVRVAFTKQYVRGPRAPKNNLGHAVEYSGRRSLPASRNSSTGARWLGTGIRGQWVIEEDRTNQVLPDSGSWHLWPVMHNWQEHHNCSSAHPTSSPPNQMYRDGQEGGGECCVCYDARIDCCLEPCQHVALCRQCALTIQRSQHSNCPLCRAPIVHVHFFGGEDSLGGPRPQRKRASPVWGARGLGGGTLGC